MALRSGYKGIKKLAAGLKWNRPGILAADDTALAKTFFPRSEQAVLGAKNFFDFDKAGIFGGAGAGITKASDHIAITGGTLTNEFIFPSDSSFRNTYNVKPNTGYILSLGDAGITNLRLQVFYKATSESTWTKLAEVISEPLLEFVTPSTFDSIWIRFEGQNGYVLGSGDIYPMLRLASDPDDTYAPYAMTNRELTAISQPTNDIIKVGRLAVVNKKIILTEPLTASWNNAHPDFADFPSPVQNTTAFCYSGGNWFNILFSEGINVASNSAIASGSTVYVTCAYITKS